MPLFHSCPVMLAEGSIILPGNYGRVVRAVGKAHPLWRRERELEEVRKRKFSSKPSRLDAAFACTNLDAARFYMQVPALQGKAGTMHPVLYEVEKVDARRG